MRNSKGQFIIGHQTWIGKHLTEDTRLKISKSLKGRPLSEATKEKMSKIRKGRPQPWLVGKRASIETRKKMSDKHRGENHWNWQGGKTKEQERIRKGLAYKLWREAVLKRDKWKCLECGRVQGWDKSIKKKITLHADHIEMFSVAIEKRLEVSNGRTLCEDCHRKTDTWGGLTRYATT